jgi:hypothetical protein
VPFTLHNLQPGQGMGFLAKLKMPSGYLHLLQLPDSLFYECNGLVLSLCTALMSLCSSCRDQGSATHRTADFWTSYIMLLHAVMSNIIRNHKLPANTLQPKKPTRQLCPQHIGIGIAPVCPSS